MKIGFGKVWMIRKRPFCRPKKIILGRIETNRNETKRRKGIIIYNIIIYKSLPLEQVTFLIRNTHKKNCGWNWAERMKKGYKLAREKTRLKVWQGVEYTRQTFSVQA